MQAKLNPIIIEALRKEVTAIQMNYILLTGFDPFGGELTNPSWEAVKSFDGQNIQGYPIVAQQIPTVFGRSLQQLKESIEKIKPAAILCIGQAGGRPDITVERIAINIDDARIPDNEGQQPIDQPVVAEGPTAYWSTLPIKEIVSELKTAGIPASVSNTAGTFVCNHIFYGVRHFLVENGLSIPAGFVHIPYLPEQGVAQTGQPTMSKETVIKALEITINTTIEHCLL